jgi:hypothetical protein
MASKEDIQADLAELQTLLGQATVRSRFAWPPRAVSL